MERTRSSDRKSRRGSPDERTRPADHLIGGIEPLAGLNAEARGILADGSVVRLFGPGMSLWRAGEIPQGLHIVLEGEVHIVRARDGRQHLVHCESAGAVIGDVPLFDGGPYPATAIAGRRVRCLYVPRDTLLAAMAADAALSRALLHSLAARVRTLVERLFNATLRTARSRLAEHLLDRAGSGPRRKRVVTLGCTHAELAERLGTARETVSREIAGLRRAGVLRGVGRGGYEIRDFDALERVATGSRS